MGRVRRACATVNRACWYATGVVPLVLVSALMVWGWFVHVWTIALWRIGGGTGLALATVSTCLFLLAWWSYLTAAFTPPGSPSNIVVSEGEVSLLPRTSPRSAVSMLRSFTLKGDGRQRFCQKCDHAKPDRAHHCRSCGRCILKMDHHCPWLATCLGHHNYKAFVLFLCYTVVWCALVAASTGLFLYGFFQSSRPEDIDETVLPINWIVLAIIATVITIVLGLFTSWHLFLLLRNYTTIEYMEETRFLGDQYTYSRNRPPPKLINIFDLGAGANWRQVMGDSVLAWFIPTARSSGDGMHFEISKEAQTRLQEQRALETAAQAHVLQEPGACQFDDYRESFDIEEDDNGPLLPTSAPVGRN